jgi:hypothetical protein
MTQHSLNKDGYDMTSVNTGGRGGRHEGLRALAELWTGRRGQTGIPFARALRAAGRCVRRGKRGPTWNMAQTTLTLQAPGQSAFSDEHSTWSRPLRPPRGIHCLPRRPSPRLPGHRRAARPPVLSVRSPLRHLVAHDSTNKYRPVNGSKASANTAKRPTLARGILPLYHRDDVDDDGHRKGNGEPTVGLPNPFVPIQWDLL